MAGTRYHYNPVTNEMEDDDGFPMLNQLERAREPQAPMVMGDIPDHQINGQIVNGRSGQRELRKTHGLIPYERISDNVRKMPMRDYNKKDDHWQDWEKLTKEKVAEKAGTTPEAFELEKKARKEFGSLRQRVKDKADGKPVSREPKIQISPEIRQYAANRAKAKKRGH
jgi:hypothetical protein